MCADDHELPPEIGAGDFGNRIIAEAPVRQAVSDVEGERDRSVIQKAHDAGIVLMPRDHPGRRICGVVRPVCISDDHAPGPHRIVDPHLRSGADEEGADRFAPLDAGQDCRIRRGFGRVGLRMKNFVELLVIVARWKRFIALDLRARAHEDDLSPNEVPDAIEIIHQPGAGHIARGVDLHGRCAKLAIRTASPCNHSKIELGMGRRFDEPGRAEVRPAGVAKAPGFQMAVRKTP